MRYAANATASCPTNLATTSTGGSTSRRFLAMLQNSGAKFFSSVDIFAAISCRNPKSNKLNAAVSRVLGESDDAQDISGSHKRTETRIRKKVIENNFIVSENIGRPIDNCWREIICPLKRSDVTDDAVPYALRIRKRFQCIDPNSLLRGSERSSDPHDRQSLTGLLKWCRETFLLCMLADWG